jgi:5'-3' exoribonuclease 2
MGVPSFFKWLVDKYPYTITPAKEDIPKEIEHRDENNPDIVKKTIIPIDTTKENPNKIEFDNLYLDMNGIIHPCCHPEGEKAPDSEEAMVEKIFEAVDRVFACVRPRKLLYFAIDGPAPRAKQNQQRSRRFRSARDAAKAEEVENIEREEMIKRGIDPPPKKHAWDTNVITPGTEFMEKVAKGLRYMIHERMNNDPGWKNLTVILSDATVPGEGEHKLVEFIRQQRLQPGYDANTSHVIHGLDADLIMLALSTHEPYFYILREKVFPRGAHVDEALKEQGAHLYEYKPMEILHVTVLREYLNTHEFPPQSFTPRLKEYDFERIVDDFVFLCFFVGNDFLPHMPSLDIREGALDLLITLYKKYLPEIGGYLTDCGDVDWKRVQRLLIQLGQVEDSIFKNRAEKEMRITESKKRKREEETQGYRDFAAKNQVFALGREGEGADNLGNFTNAYSGKTGNYNAYTPESNKDAARKLKQDLLGESEPVAVPEEIPVPEEVTEEPPRKRVKLDNDVVVEEPQPSTDVPVATREASVEEVQKFIESVKSKVKEMQTVDPILHPDNVKFGEEGWKDRYYREKFKTSYDPTSYDCQHIVQSYVQGLLWVFRYYYRGCNSWSWYYPYHYAPFASDLVNLEQLEIDNFEMGEPFKPYDQLMGVLPPASAHALPVPYQSLMLDEESPIIDFYPLDFRIDMNGKAMAWQGISILPFIEADRLLKETKVVEPKITEEEARRNTLGLNVIYCRTEHQLNDNMMALYIDPDDNARVTIALANKDPKRRTIGWVPAGILMKDPLTCPPSDTYEPPFESENLEKIPNNMVMSAIYELPPLQKHIPKLLPTVVIPSSILDEAEQFHVDLDSDTLEMIIARHIRSNFTRGGGRGGRGGGNMRGGGRGGYNDRQPYDPNRRHSDHRDNYNSYNQQDDRRRSFENKREIDYSVGDSRQERREPQRYSGSRRERDYPSDRNDYESYDRRPSDRYGDRQQDYGRSDRQPERSHNPYGSSREGRSHDRSSDRYDDRRSGSSDQGRRDPRHHSSRHEEYDPTRSRHSSQDMREFDHKPRGGSSHRKDNPYQSSSQASNPYAHNAPRDPRERPYNPYGGAPPANTPPYQQKANPYQQYDPNKQYEKRY